jgi:cobalamin transport system ATP-binding protein
LVIGSKEKVIVLMSEDFKKYKVKAENLSIGYKNRKNENVLLSGISFDLEESSLIGLVGANGIGKSTLLRTLNGMQPALSGSISIMGEPLNSIIPQTLATYLSVVLTEAPSSKNLSVLEFISLGRQPYTNWLGRLSSEDQKNIDLALELTDTKKIAHQKCYELSDGQMQRVAIARALAQDTPIIMLDEPTTHLDLYHRAAVLKLLKRLTEEMNKTILFSTHEIDLAIQLSDRMMVMTPTDFYYNAPCKLIEHGNFTALFPEDTILFDQKSGRFTVKD